MTYALIKNNVVVSIEVLTADVAASLRSQYTVMSVDGITPAPQVGWTLSNGVLSGPPPVQSWIITKLALRERFTMPELMGIEAASVGTSTEALELQALMDNLMVASYIDLQRPDTQAGIQALVAFGLLTQSRANAILTTPPAASELYKG